jgi:hypothetical protein
MPPSSSYHHVEKQKDPLRILENPEGSHARSTVGSSTQAISIARAGLGRLKNKHYWFLLMVAVAELITTNEFALLL